MVLKRLVLMRRCKSDIRIGCRLARHLGARVALLHVTHAETEARPLVRRHLNQAAATLNALEVQNEILIRSDLEPVDAIVRESAVGDLLVIGGHGPQAKSVLRRDDKALQVLTRARSPVLVVPAEK